MSRPEEHDGLWRLATTSKLYQRSECSSEWGVDTDGEAPLPASVEEVELLPSNEARVELCQVSAEEGGVDGAPNAWKKGSLKK